MLARDPGQNPLALRLGHEPASLDQMETETLIQPEPCKECGEPTTTIVCGECRANILIGRESEADRKAEEAHRRAKAELRARREAFLLAKYQYLGCNVCGEADAEVLMAAPAISSYDGPTIAVMLNRSYSEERMGKQLKWFRVWCWNCYKRKHEPDALY